MLDLGGLFSGPRPLDNALHLERDRGTAIHEIAVGEPANGLYLEVSGRVAFESARVEYASGACDSLDLRGMSRGNGLYQLIAFGDDRPVERVVLTAHARSREAWVGLRLGR